MVQDEQQMTEGNSVPLMDGTATQSESQPTPQKMSKGELVRRMVKSALTPQKIILLVVFLLAAFVCGRLGVWQLDRAYERANLAKQHAIEEAANERPANLSDVLLPQSSFGGSLVGKRVVVTGEFEPENQFLVTNRTVDGQLGFLVLDSLVVTEDGSGGSSWSDLSGNPRLPVVRGWVPADAVGADGQLTDDWDSRIAAVDTPTVVTGWLQASESTLTEILPAGQTNSVSSAALANAWGGPIYSGYLVVQESDPADNQAITKLPRPSIEGSDGLNMQNMFYALQWWLFGGFAVVLWLRLVRDDAKRAALEKPINPFDILDAQS